MHYFHYSVCWSLEGNREIINECRIQLFNNLFIFLLLTAILKVFLFNIQN